MSLDWIQYQFIGFEWFWCSFCQPPYSLPLCRRIQFPGSTSMLVRNGSISLKSVNVGNERQYKHPFHFPFNRNKLTKTTRQTKRSPTACFQISVDDITWGGGLDGEKTDSNISARGRYWLLPRYPQHMKFVTIYSLAGWKQQCNMPYHLPYTFLKRRLKKCGRIGVLGWSIDKIYPPMVRSEESIS